MGPPFSQSTEASLSLSFDALTVPRVRDAGFELNM